MKKREAKIIRIAGLIFIILYTIVLAYFLFFSEDYGRTAGGREYSYNLVLFKEVKRFITYREKLGTFVVLSNLLGNVIGFIPFGLILPIINKKRRRFIIIALISFQISLAIEIAQLFLKVGSFDVDDLFLNTMGGIIGYVIFFIANKIRRKYYG